MVASRAAAAADTSNMETPPDDVADATFPQPHRYVKGTNETPYERRATC